MGRPRTPPVAVDLVIELAAGEYPRIVLIRRRNPPHGWALPGGFVDVGETVGAAALREAREETCLEVTLKSLLGVYSDPGRDPRGQTVSIVFVATATGTPRPADDAAEVLLADPARPPELVFDHARIVADYRRLLRSGTSPLPD